MNNRVISMKLTLAMMDRPARSHPRMRKDGQYTLWGSGAAYVCQVDVSWCCRAWVASTWDRRFLQSRRWVGGQGLGGWAPGPPPTSTRLPLPSSPSAPLAYLKVTNADGSGLAMASFWPCRMTLLRWSRRAK